jgi:cyclopropane fatty-acyl-phospholipid synthase-like methyltransferase
MPAQESRKAVEKFYSEANCFLELFWSGSTHMIHFGYCGDDPSSKLGHEQSLIETVRQVALRLKPISGERILDAGCGVGGAALWFAKHYDVKVVGITNVPLHAKEASEHARRVGIVAGAVEFKLADYIDTGFENGSFAAIYAIESVCYAADKLAFLKEAHRLLADGGRLVVLDGFRTQRGNMPEDERLMQSWLNGWGANDLDTIDEFTAKAREAGFSDISLENLQSRFADSHRRAHNLARLFLPAAIVLTRLGLLPKTIREHCYSSHDLWLAASRDLFIQGIFSAKKQASA